MKSAEPDPFAHYDAAYLLGALPGQDAADFERHLAGCAACTASVTELAGLPGLLARVRDDDVRQMSRGDVPHADPSVGAQPPPSILPSVLARASAGRRRRLVKAASGTLGAAAVLVLIVVAFAAGGAGERVAGPGPSSSRTVLTMQPVDQAVVTATMTLEDVRWGTKINLRCTYASGRYPDSGVYALVVKDSAGRYQQVATWQAVVGRTVTVPAATSLKRQDITQVEVRRVGGDTMLILRP